MVAACGSPRARRRYQKGDAGAAVVQLRRAVALAELHARPSVLVARLVYLADAELGVR